MAASKRRPWGTPGLREQIDGVWGTWTRAPNGGVWFRPDGWKPKVHLVPKAYEGEIAFTTLCGKDTAYGRGFTTNPEEVTCGSCINSMTIRRFRVLMILVAALVWANSVGADTPERRRTMNECHICLEEDDTVMVRPDGRKMCDLCWEDEQLKKAIYREELYESQK